MSPCPECGRPLQGKSPRCIYCGAKVQPLAESSAADETSTTLGVVTAGAASTGVARAAPSLEQLRAKVHTVYCATCSKSTIWDDRDLQKAIATKGAFCKRCSNRLRLPDEVEDFLRAQITAPARPRVACPVCGTYTPSLPEANAVLKCQRCSMCFMAPIPDGGDHARTGPVAAGDRADEVAVQTAAGVLTPSDQNAFVAGALRARAALGEVLAGEPVAVCGAKAAIDASETLPAFLTLPIPPEQAVHAILPLLFGVRPFITQPSPPGLELWVDLHTTAEVDTGAAAAFAGANVVGLAAEAALGVGFSATPSREDLTELVQHRARVRLEPTPSGTHLDFSTQKGDAKPRALEPHLQQAVHDQLVERLRTLQAYFALVAVYGPWARGIPLALVNEAALTGRLTHLGCAVEVATLWAGSLRNAMTDYTRVF